MCKIYYGGTSNNMKIASSELLAFDVKKGIIKWNIL